MVNHARKHKTSGALLTAALFSFTVFFTLPGNYTKGHRLSTNASFKKESLEPIVLRNSESNAVSFTSAIKDSVAVHTYDCSIEELPDITLALAEALFINIYQRNTFYVFISINAP